MSFAQKKRTAQKMQALFQPNVAITDGFPILTRTELRLHNHMVVIIR